MDLSAPIATAKPQSGESADTQRVVAAARQFEAVLLESFVQPLQETFSSLPGGEDGLSVGGYRDMGTQAMASALAQAGGLHLAEMVVRNLLHLHNLPGKLRPLVQGDPMAFKVFGRTPIVTESSVGSLGEMRKQ